MICEKYATYNEEICFNKNLKYEYGDCEILRFDR